MNIDSRIDQNSHSSLENNIGTLQTENISKSFFVPASRDDDFNSRMKENELNVNHLFDVHVQEFMDEGYSKQDATQRTSQFALIGVLDIPGQFNISNLLFDKNASSDIKDIFAQTLKSTFNVMSNEGIGSIIAEMLPPTKSDALTPISSRAFIPNPEPAPTAHISRAQAESFGMTLSAETMEEFGMKDDEDYKAFLLGPIVYYNKEEDDNKKDKYKSIEPNFSSFETIETYFHSIINKLTAIQNDEEIPEDQKRNSQSSIASFKLLIARLHSTVDNKMEEDKNNENLLYQYTKNNKINIIDERSKSNLV